MPTSVQLARGAPDRQPESIGPLLARLRLRRGHSQLRLAEQLCAASGVPTVTRHEVSRWERGQRVPGPFWLGWLAAVLEVPLDALLAAPRPARHVTQPRPAEAARTSGGATGAARAPGWRDGGPRELARASG
ncbi:MAG TPA: helix-turn-helix transcriptional regulator [Pilimelia sp.]|nr:helix-turn-helix transcriptional regulator [Pilimelia sp.]